MKIAIHKSNWSFSLEWISYCEQNRIDYKIVDCYSSDIIWQLENCDILLWHHHHSISRDTIFAKELLFSLQQAGIIVFPNFNTSWYFDDKLGQKYLLEKIKAPLVPTYVFYDKRSAKKFIDSKKFPIVFKLRGGAGSNNVTLIKTKNKAYKIINQAFGRGFSQYNKRGNLLEVLRLFKFNIESTKNVIKSLRRLFVSTEFARIKGREKGYVLYQKFIPNNNFDIRVVVIGSKAFAIKRMVRKNDFRASGSGVIRYDKMEIDTRCVQIAFQTSLKLNAQCLAYDFVFDDATPLIVEINYGFAHKAYESCPGYWDDELKWHNKKVSPTKWIIEDLIREFNG